MSDNPEEHLQCMEVWGGSQAVDRAVQMGGLDAWVYSKPFESSEILPQQAGGDVYYASSCATGRIHRLLLADVSGHGQAVAKTAMELRGLMRRYVNYLDQKQFVRAMNHQFSLDAKDGSFATALVTTFFSPNRIFSICNAGHPHPLLYRAAENAWSLLDHSVNNDSETPRNIPLGIFDLADYEQFDIKLNAGDMVLCYTDALTESRAADGELLGEQRLLEMAGKVEMKEPRGFAGDLLAAIGALHPGNLAGDDVTVLLLRCSQESRRVSLGEKFTGFARMIGAVAANLRPRGRPPLPDFNMPNIGGAIIPALSKRWRGIR